MNSKPDKLKTVSVLSIIFTSLLLLSCGHNMQKVNSTEAKENRIVTTVPEFMYVGTYTKKEGHVDGKANGIYLVKINTINGSAELVSTVAEMENPSFVERSPDGKNLYAVSELTGEDGGYIYAFTINDDNSLALLNKLPTNGLAPCHTGLDKTGQLVFVANYVGGVVMVYKRDDDGSLTVSQKIVLNNPGVSNAHMAIVSPDNRFLFVVDKGNDAIWSFIIDPETGTVIPNKVPSKSLPKGAGPRHLAFHPNGKFAYVINELGNTISAFKYDSTNGRFNDLQTITTLPENYKEPNTTAEIQIHPNGKFLYGSNRGLNNIVLYSINEQTGRLTLKDFTPTLGEIPRYFTIDPTGKFLYAANQNSDSIVLFDIHKKNGTLAYSGHALAVKTPVSMVFD